VYSDWCLLNDDLKVDRFEKSSEGVAAVYKASMTEEAFANLRSCINLPANYPNCFEFSATDLSYCSFSKSKAQEAMERSPQEVQDIARLQLKPLVHAPATQSLVAQAKQIF
jgi:hypothetical protein